MNKILGIFGLLIFVCLFTTVLTENFDTALNLYNVTRWSALFGIISIGVAFVIITGGIDLSIGSIVCLSGCVLSILIMDKQWSVYSAIVAVMGISMGLGLVHGLLITKLRLQPFVVTLCGLLFYRGFARWYAADQPQGFGQVHNDGLRQLAIGKPWTDYECNFAQFVLIIGVVAALAMLGRVIWQAVNKRPLGAPLTIFGFAVLLAVIGSSQYWAPGGQTVVVKVLSKSIALEPATLMHWSGLLIFIPAAMAFITFGFREHVQKTVVPLSLLILSALLFVLVSRFLAPQFDQISPGDEALREFLGISMQGGTVRNLIMVLVFLVTAMLMGSIGWTASSVSSVSKKARSVFGVLVFGAVLWLVGLTELLHTFVPMPLLILIGCATIASVFLNQTIYGRYLLALGRNEEAARYSGINTDRMIILAYVICAGMAGLGAVLFALDINNMQPASHGNIYELYAIAAAVLGGCSLRGGEGSIAGVIIGAAVMRVLYNAINTLGIDTRLEWAIIGIVILTGVIADEVVKRLVASKRAKMQAEQFEA